MIKYIKKDVTTVTRGVVAHGCNCQGVMGSGVALAIKNKWPKAFESYAHYCQWKRETPEDLLGHCLIINVNPDKLNSLFVANLFTQITFGRSGQRYADPLAVNTSLHDAVGFANGATLPLYMPRIGCGLGGLDWATDVEPIVEALGETYPNTTIYVCDL